MFEQPTRPPTEIANGLRASLAIRTTGVWGPWSEIMAIWLLFCLLSAGLAPDVNEAHYLAKARHYWQPEWCSRDFFLNSADAHRMFYRLFGWTTVWLPFPACAYLGRAITGFLLACSWHRLSDAVAPRSGLALVTAALMASGVAWCHLSGEWLLGGVEAKSFAFPCVLLGWSYVACDNWRACWVWLGIATSLHPLVGGWAWMSAGFVWLLAGQSLVQRRGQLAWILAGLVCAAPGLWDVLWLMSHTTAGDALHAGEIYVHSRLSHHLLPSAFGAGNWIRWSGLVLLWGVLTGLGTHDRRLRRTQAMVVGSLLTAAAGGIVFMLTRDDSLQAAQWMRYYWFRWSDIAVPVGVALALGSMWHVPTQWHSGLARRANLLATLRVLMCGLAIAGTTAAAWNNLSRIPNADRQALSLAVRDPEWQRYIHWNWQKACAWIAEKTPSDAIFLTPRGQQTFHWYAQRAEVVNWKNVPQDARGIVEWWDRFQNVYGQFHGDPNGNEPGSDGDERAPRRHLAELARRYDATFVIVLNRDTLTLPSNTALAPNADLPHARLPTGEWEVWTTRFVNDVFVVLELGTLPVREPSDR